MELDGLTSLSDDALLAGLAVGDADASREFVRRYQARVYGLALGIVRDSGLAADVAQEAFVRAWRHAQAFDHRRGTVSAWLLRITRNLAIDTLRLRRPLTIDPHVLTYLDAVVDGTGVEDAVLIGDATDRVRVALQSLPVDQARALLLAAYYGHTAKEISDFEQIPLGTAKTRIRLALRRVRSLLVDPAALEDAS